LPQEFPSEVQPLVDELNHLLDHDERLVKRARTQLGDLAHAVKNPLTIIRNEARQMPNEKGQLILDQSHIMSSNIDHYLSLARTFGKNPLGLRTAVKPVIEDLCYVVEHVYADRHIKISLSGLEDCWFRGESQDLEEMAGNLLDNACKWARSRVEIRGDMDLESLVLIIEDDGPGVPADKLGEVLKRGRRLDDKTPGSGQGLGIVKDVTDLYRGKLTLSKSELGGLRATLELPGQ
jgi:signal transduction histidine kinase